LGAGLSARLVLGLVAGLGAGLDDGSTARLDANRLNALLMLGEQLGRRWAGFWFGRRGATGLDARLDDGLNGRLDGGINAGHLVKL